MCKYGINFFVGPFIVLSLLFFPPDIGSARENADNASGDLKKVLEGFDGDEDAGEKVPGLEDVFEGFEEETPKGADIGAPVSGPSFLDIDGALKLGVSYNYAHGAPEGDETDYRGLSRLRLELDLNLDITFSESWDARAGGRGFYDFAYTINGRGEYTDEVLNAYEQEAEFGELYIRGSVLPSLDMKIGRQIVVWGASDDIRIVDVLNPLDNREPGLIDIEYLRLPLTMTRLDYYAGNWNLTGIAIHEIRFDKNPEFGSDFFPSDSPSPYERIPSNGGGNTEYAAALKGILTGWDISFHWARVFDDRPHMESVSPGIIPQAELRHSRLTMVGAALNIAMGNYLLKSEGAWFYGLEFFALPDEKKSRFDMLIGVEYSGFKDTVISLELADRHINGFDSRLEKAPDAAQKNEFLSALRYRRDFLHDTFHITILALTYDGTGQDGSLQRFSVEYDVEDDVSVTGGIVNYRSGDAIGFRNIEDNDRLFLEAEYSF